MDGPRVDEVAKAFARGASRRAVVRHLGGIAAGGLLLIARSSRASANHASRHCAKTGKRCHRHKDCCGLCGLEGVCLSCDGVTAWADANLARLAETEDLSDTALTAIGEITAGEAFDAEALGAIEAAAGAIGQFSSELSIEVTPPAAANPLRALLELLAAMAQALEDYLEQVSEESYIETGEHAMGALTEIAAGIPPLQAEIAALRETCAA